MFSHSGYLIGSFIWEKLFFQLPSSVVGSVFKQRPSFFIRPNGRLFPSHIHFFISYLDSTLPRQEFFMQLPLVVFKVICLKDFRLFFGPNVFHYISLIYSHGKPLLHRNLNNGSLANGLLFWGASRL